MAAIHTESSAIFGHKNVNVAEERIQFVDYKPINPITPNTFIEFTIPGTDNRYISLKDTLIKARVEFRLTRTENVKRMTKPLPPIGYQGEVKELLDLPQDDSRSKRSVPDDTSPASRSSSYNNHEEQLLLDAEYDKAATVWENYVRTAYHPNSDYAPQAYPIDAIFHTMWSGVDVFMNHTLVSTTNTMYAYKSYIETLLNNSSATKKYQLPAIGFTGNRSNAINPLEPDVETNPLELSTEHGERKLRLCLNKTHDIMGHLSSDVWGINASILNGVQISIKLFPNKDAFRMMSYPVGVEAEMIIKDITLRVCKKTLSPEVIIAHNKALTDVNDATYPFIRTEVRAFNVPKGMRSAVIENPYQSNIPARLILGMVRGDAKAGNFQSNPLKFQHFHLASAGFYINNTPVPRLPYQLDPENGAVLEPLMELYSILGKMGEDKDIGLSIEDYLDSNFLIPFDVQPTASGNLNYLAKREGGHCMIDLHFSKPLPCNVCLITYAIFPSTIAIDLARNVKVIDLEKPFKIYSGDKNPDKVSPMVV